MVSPGRPADYLELLETASSLIVRHGARDASGVFGLDDLLAEGVTDDDGATAVFAYLEAQGQHAELEPATVLARFPVAIPELISLASGALYAEAVRGTTHVAVAGWRSGCAVVVNEPAHGLVLLHGCVKVPTPESLDSCEYVVTLDTVGAERSLLVGASEAAEFGTVMRTRHLMGATAEMLGASSRMLDDAVEYSRTRQQFGQSIDAFTPVQTMLAWAATERHQLRALFDIAVGSNSSLEARDFAATVTKVLAGRVSRAITQQTLQVTGGIGFTWEYTHHRLQRRVLALDALGGSAAQLAREVGASVRSGGGLPDLVDLSR